MPHDAVPDDHLRESQPHFDLVVCGAGLAGLVASARAAELGARVIVLEAGDGEGYLCNSRVAGGVLHAAYQDLTRGREHIAAALLHATGGEASPGLLDAIAIDAERTLTWLRSQGIRVMRASNLSLGAWVLTPPRRLVTHLEWRGFGSDVALRTLLDRIRSRGGELRQRTRATELLMRDGRCIGVSAISDGVTTHYLSRAVVLADGGFAGNRDLFRSYIGPRPDLVVQRGAGTGLGDGLRMAMEVGAATSDLRWFYGHLLSRTALENDRLWPYPQLDFVATAGIIVNRDGRRMMDEGLGGIYAANMLAQMAEPTNATVIIGDSIWKGPGARDGMIPANPKVEEFGGAVFKANSVEALATKAGINLHGLHETLDEYKAAVERKTLHQLDPPRSERKAPAWPITAPYLALPACAGITYTTGGVLIDEWSHVLSKGGGPIEGLYAAGATTGGLEGGSLAAYVGGLMKAAVQGLRAGESATAQ